ncbi:MAG TPA: hypothetical protein VF488_14400 [Gemmatimonadaceae bacterium]
MSPILVQSKDVLRRSALACVLAGLAACGDRSLVTGAGKIPIPPLGSGSIIAAVEGTVDDAGNVTFSPMAAPMAPGVSAQVYGSQNVNVRLYNTPTVIDSTSIANTKRWSFDVGIRNLLSYPIGSNQNGAAPADTMGLTVFFTVPPTVTAPTPCDTPCGLTIANPDGTGNFTGVGQSYFYWHERLGATTAVPSTDTTLRRRTWTFQGNKKITNFRFVVLVSAAWPPPNDTRWKVFYDGTTDSLPDTQASPPWKQRGLLGGGTEDWTTPPLALNAASGRDIFLFRRDSLAAATPAYMEAKVTVNKGSKSVPIATFGLVDGSRMAAVGIASSRIGFVSLTGTTWSFVGTTWALDASTSHVYRVSKNGSQDATIWVDGQAVVTATYASLPAGGLGTLGATAFFGDIGQSGRTKSLWSYVTYELGVTGP